MREQLTRLARAEEWKSWMLKRRVAAAAAEAGGKRLRCEIEREGGIVTTRREDCRSRQAARHETFGFNQHVGTSLAYGVPLLSMILRDCTSARDTSERKYVGTHLVVFPMEIRMRWASCPTAPRAGRQATI